MFPEDMQALMAKIIFFIFATCVLCFGRLGAFEVEHFNISNELSFLQFLI